MAESARRHLEALADCVSSLVASLGTVVYSDAADKLTAPSTAVPGPRAPPPAPARLKHQRQSELAELDGDDPLHPVSLVKRALRLRELLEADAEKIRDHQAFQRRIEHVRQLISEQESLRVDIVSRLHSAKEAVDKALRRARACQVQRAGPEGRPLSVDEIVNLAGKLANYTSAPAGYNPSAANQFGDANLPFPTELDMRLTLMNHPNMGLSLPEETAGAAGGVLQAGPGPEAGAMEIQDTRPPPAIVEAPETEEANPFFDLDLNPDLE